MECRNCKEKDLWINRRQLFFAWWAHHWLVLIDSILSLDQTFWRVEKRMKCELILRHHTSVKTCEEWWMFCSNQIIPSWKTNPCCSWEIRSGVSIHIGQSWWIFPRTGNESLLIRRETSGKSQLSLLVNAISNDAFLRPSKFQQLKNAQSCEIRARILFAPSLQSKEQEKKWDTSVTETSSSVFATV